MDSTITIIVSSGLVSVAVTLCTILIAFGKYKEKIDTHGTNIEKHDNKINTLSDRVSRLEGGIDRDREYIDRKSPLSLTEKGKALLLDCGGKDFIDNNKKNLIEAINLHHPKTAYDVQELSRQVITEQSNDDNFNAIKNFTYMEGLALETVINVLGIYLRDIALDELKFNITDIKD